MNDLEKKKIIDLWVALVLASAFLFSAVIKVNLYGYEQIVKWLMIITFLTANISLTSSSWKKRWSRYDWFEWLSFLYIDAFLILLVLNKANIYWRIITLLVIFIDILMPTQEERKAKSVKEIKKEAKILKNAEKKFEEHLSEARKEKTAKYFGSKTGHIVHKVGCPIGERIKKKNRIYFSTTKEANRRGYKNCKVCIK